MRCETSPVLVSACLLGLKTRYDGQGKLHSAIMERLRESWVIPVCPEQLGGLSTPRNPAEIRGGSGMDVLEKRASVVDAMGNDLTEAFIKGGLQCLRIAQITGAPEAILKSKSPSCGLTPWPGVTAALLILNGIRVQEVD